MKIRRIVLVSVFIFLLGILKFRPSVLGIKTPVVLMYHLIEEEPFTELESLFVRPDDFDAHLKMLKEEGYGFLFASEYTQSVNNKSVIITFDDGYLDNYTEMLPILQRNGAKATIFVAGGNLGKPNFIDEEQLVALAESPCIEIGSHTMNHALMTQISKDEVRTELEESKSVLERITGLEVTSFSFPEGDFSLKLLKDTGKYYDTAFITRTARPGVLTNRYKIPRISVSRGVSAEDLSNLIKTTGFR